MTSRLERAVTDLMQHEMEQFAEWCSKQWTITPDVFKSDNVFDTKPEGYREGYNAALEGLPLALEQYLESNS
ncbi:hypothetical protein [Agrobacterium sp. CG674]